MLRMVSGDGERGRSVEWNLDRMSLYLSLISSSYVDFVLSRNVQEKSQMIC